MTHPIAAACLLFLGVLLVFLVAVAGFSATGGGDAVNNMWDMMDGTGGMMDGGGGMGGMMGRGSGGPTTTGSASGEGAVRIADFSFQPTTLNVTLGTVVTWTNEDSAPHTATGDDFDTGMLKQGDPGSVTFDSAGSYDYICTYHPSMKGQIVVSPR